MARRPRAPEGTKDCGDNLKKNGVEGGMDVSARSLGEMSPRAVAVSQQKGPEAPQL